MPQSTDKASSADRKEQLLKTLEACGELGTVQLAETLGLERSGVALYLKQLIAEGLVTKHGAGRAVTYILASADRTGRPKVSGFKRWLRKTGQKSAEGRAPRKKAAKRRTPKAQPLADMVARKTRAAATAVVAVPVAAPASSALDCGLYSSGGISIARGNDVLRLDRAESRQLIDWLLKVDAVLRATA